MPITGQSSGIGSAAPAEEKSPPSLMELLWVDRDLKGRMTTKLSEARARIVALQTPKKQSTKKPSSLHSTPAPPTNFGAIIQSLDECITILESDSILPDGDPQDSFIKELHTHFFSALSAVYLTEVIRAKLNFRETWRGVDDTDDQIFLAVQNHFRSDRPQKSESVTHGFKVFDKQLNLVQKKYRPELDRFCLVQTLLDNTSLSLLFRLSLIEQKLRAFPDDALFSTYPTSVIDALERSEKSCETREHAKNAISIATRALKIRSTALKKTTPTPARASRSLSSPAAPAKPSADTRDIEFSDDDFQRLNIIPPRQQLVLSAEARTALRAAARPAPIATGPDRDPSQDRVLTARDDDGTAAGNARTDVAGAAIEEAIKTTAQLQAQFPNLLPASGGDHPKDGGHVDSRDGNAPGSATPPSPLAIAPVDDADAVTTVEPPTPLGRPQRSLSMPIGPAAGASAARQGSTPPASPRHGVDGEATSAAEAPPALIRTGTQQRLSGATPSLASAGSGRHRDRTSTTDTIGYAAASDDDGTGNKILSAFRYVCGMNSVVLPSKADLDQSAPQSFNQICGPKIPRGKGITDAEGLASALHELIDRGLLRFIAAANLAFNAGAGRGKSGKIYSEAFVAVAQKAGWSEEDATQLLTDEEIQLQQRLLQSNAPSSPDSNDDTSAVLEALSALCGLHDVKIGEAEIPAGLEQKLNAAVATLRGQGIAFPETSGPDLTHDSILGVLLDGESPLLSEALRHLEDEEVRGEYIDALLALVQIDPFKPLEPAVARCREALVPQNLLPQFQNAQQTAAPSRARALALQHATEADVKAEAEILRERGAILSDFFGLLGAFERLIQQLREAPQVSPEEIERKHKLDRFAQEISDWRTAYQTDQTSFALITRARTLLALILPFVNTAHEKLTSLNTEVRKQIAQHAEEKESNTQIIETLRRRLASAEEKITSSTTSPHSQLDKGADHGESQEEIKQLNTLILELKTRIQELVSDLQDLQRQLDAARAAAQKAEEGKATAEEAAQKAKEEKAAAEEAARKAEEEKNAAEEKTAAAEAELQDTKHSVRNLQQQLDAQARSDTPVPLDSVMALAKKIVTSLEAESKALQVLSPNAAARPDAESKALQVFSPNAAARSAVAPSTPRQFRGAHIAALNSLHAAMLRAFGSADPVSQMSEAINLFSQSVRGNLGLHLSDLRPDSDDDDASVTVSLVTPTPTQTLARSRGVSSSTLPKGFAPAAPAAPARSRAPSSAAAPAAHHRDRSGSSFGDSAQLRPFAPPPAIIPIETLQQFNSIMGVVCEEYRKRHGEMCERIRLRIDSLTSELEQAKQAQASSGVDASRISELEKELTALRAVMDEQTRKLSEEAEAAKAEANAAREAKAAAEAEVLKLQTEIAKLTDKLAAANQRADEAEAKANARVKTEIDELRAQIVLLTEQKTQAESRAQTAKAELETANQKIAALEGELETLRHTNQEQKAQIAALSEENQGLLSSMRTLREQVQRTLTANDSLQATRAAAVHAQSVDMVHMLYAALDAEGKQDSPASQKIFANLDIQNSTLSFDALTSADSKDAIIAALDVLRDVVISRGDSDESLSLNDSSELDSFLTAHRQIQDTLSTAHTAALQRIQRHSQTLATRASSAEEKQRQAEQAAALTSQARAASSTTTETQTDASPDSPAVAAAASLPHLGDRALAEILAGIVFQESPPAKAQDDSSSPSKSSRPASPQKTPASDTNSAPTRSKSANDVKRILNSIGAHNSLTPQASLTQSALQDHFLSTFTANAHARIEAQNLILAHIRGLKIQISKLQREKKTTGISEGVQNALSENAALRAQNSDQQQQLTQLQAQLRELQSAFGQASLAAIIDRLTSTLTSLTDSLRADVAVAGGAKDSIRSLLGGLPASAEPDSVQEDDKISPAIIALRTALNEHQADLKTPFSALTSAIRSLPATAQKAQLLSGAIAVASAITQAQLQTLDEKREKESKDQQAEIRSTLLRSASGHLFHTLKRAARRGGGREDNRREGGDNSAGAGGVSVGDLRGVLGRLSARGGDSAGAIVDQGGVRGDLLRAIVTRLGGNKDDAAAGSGAPASSDAETPALPLVFSEETIHAAVVEVVNSPDVAIETVIAAIETLTSELVEEEEKAREEKRVETNLARFNAALEEACEAVDGVESVDEKLKVAADEFLSFAARSLTPSPSTSGGGGASGTALSGQLRTKGEQIQKKPADYELDEATAILSRIAELAGKAVQKKLEEKLADLEEELSQLRSAQRAAPVADAGGQSNAAGDGGAEDKSAGLQQELGQVRAELAALRASNAELLRTSFETARTRAIDALGVANDLDSKDAVYEIIKFHHSLFTPGNAELQLGLLESSAGCADEGAWPSWSSALPGDGDLISKAIAFLKQLKPQDSKPTPQLDAFSNAVFGAVLAQKEEELKRSKEQASALRTQLAALNQQLEESKDQHAEEKARLEGELQMLRATLDEKTQALTTLSAECEQLRAQLKQLEQKDTELESERDALTAQVAQLQAALAASKKEKATFQTRINDLTQQLATSLAAGDEKDQKNAELTAELKHVRTQLTLVTENNVRIQADLDTARKTIEEKDTQIADLNRQLTASRARVVELEGKLQTETDAKAGLQAQLEEAQNALRNANARHAEEKAVLEARVAELEAQLQEKEAKISSITDEKTAAEEAVHALEQQLAEQRTENERLRGILENFKTTFEQFNRTTAAKMAEMNIAIELLLARANSLHADLTRVTGENNDLNRLVRKQGTEILSIRQKLNEAKAENAAFLEALEKKNAELDVLRAHVQKLEVALAQENEINSELADELADYRNELSAAEKRISALQRQVNEQATKIAELSALLRRIHLETAEFSSRQRPAPIDVPRDLDDELNSSSLYISPPSSANSNLPRSHAPTPHPHPDSPDPSSPEPSDDGISPQHSPRSPRSGRARRDSIDVEALFDKWFALLERQREQMERNHNAAIATLTVAHRQQLEKLLEDSDAHRTASKEQIEQLIAAHEKALHSAQETHRESMERMNSLLEDLRSQLEAERKENREERTRDAKQNQDFIERLEGKFLAEIAQIRTDHKAHIQMLSDQYKTIIAELKAGFDARIADLKADRDRLLTSQAQERKEHKDEIKALFTDARADRAEDRKFLKDEIAAMRVRHAEERKEMEARISDLQKRSDGLDKARLDDMKTAHDRELKAQEKFHGDLLTERTARMKAESDAASKIAAAEASAQEAKNKADAAIAEAKKPAPAAAPAPAPAPAAGSSSASGSASGSASAAPSIELSVGSAPVLAPKSSASFSGSVLPSDTPASFGGGAVRNAGIGGVLSVASFSPLLLAGLPLLPVLLIPLIAGALLGLVASRVARAASLSMTERVNALSKQSPDAVDGSGKTIKPVSGMIRAFGSSSVDEKGQPIPVSSEMLGYASPGLGSGVIFGIASIFFPPLLIAGLCLAMVGALCALIPLARNYAQNEEQIAELQGKSKKIKDEHAAYKGRIHAITSGIADNKKPEQIFVFEKEVDGKKRYYLTSLSYGAVCTDAKGELLLSKEISSHAFDVLNARAEMQKSLPEDQRTISVSRASAASTPTKTTFIGSGEDGKPRLFTQSISKDGKVEGVTSESLTQDEYMKHRMNRVPDYRDLSPSGIRQQRHNGQGAQAWWQ